MNLSPNFILDVTPHTSECWKTDGPSAEEGRERRCIWHLCVRNLFRLIRLSHMVDLFFAARFYLQLYSAERESICGYFLQCDILIMHLYRWTYVFIFFIKICLLMMWIELCGNIWSFKIISRLNVVKTWTSLENSDQWAWVRNYLL